MRIDFLCGTSHVRVHALGWGWRSLLALFYFRDLCRYFTNHLLESIHVWAFSAIHGRLPPDTFIHRSTRRRGAQGQSLGQFCIFFLLRIIWKWATGTLLWWLSPLLFQTLELMTQGGATGQNLGHHKKAILFFILQTFIGINPTWAFDLWQASTGQV